jgi:Icc-related predicted phosphoesterase
MKVLSLSDVVVARIYSPQIRSLYGDVDFVLGCGDLPYYYLEYVVSALNVPVFFVRGNHAEVVEEGEAGPRYNPHGAIDLHRRAISYQGLLLAGVEGSLRYRKGNFQYTQAEMWWNVFSLIPSLLQNRLLYGRYLDIFVSHASPWGIHDQPDLPHQGIKAFRWLLQVFKPAYHFHGHIHVYRPGTVVETKFEDTMVINTFGLRVSEVEAPVKSQKT